MQAEIAEHHARLLDQITALTGMASACVRALVEVKKQLADLVPKGSPADIAEQVIAKLNDELTGARGALIAAQRECAEARADRDKAEAIVTKQRAEIAALRRKQAPARKKRK